MNQKIKIFLALLVVLIIPIALFFLLSAKRDDVKLMPDYYLPMGDDIYQENGKIHRSVKYRQLKDITLINQLGDTVSLNEDLKGKNLIINFIFTTCPSICPNMTQNLSVMQKSFLKKIPEKFQFLSISIDPTKDTPEVLRDYANNYTTHHDKWWFLTGDQEEIFNFMKNELGLKLDSDDPNHIDHSVTTVLVDADRFVRGYYNTLDPIDLNRAANEAVLMTMEKKKKK